MSLCINGLQQMLATSADELSMAKYLVTCTCGRQLAVETGQAGESLTCDCGATVAVPPFRQLRELPVERQDAAPAAGSTWGLREGAITVCLLVALACLIAATASRYSEQPLPTIDPVARTESVDRELTNMTPLQAWELWQNSYKQLAATGFEVYKHPAANYLQQNLNWHKWIQIVTLSAAAVCAALAGALAFTKKKIA
jgi:hypothetical protein